MRLRSLAPWLLLALFGAEFFLFDKFGAHRFTSIYPRWNDQVQYLGEAYTGHENARIEGLVLGLWQALTHPSAQGPLLDTLAVGLFAFTGPSRSAALALNLLALVAWQAALWFAIDRTTRSRALAFAAAALPLALAGPWSDIPGSAYDFRLDHFAMCALGVASAAALLTDGFRARRWSMVFGVAVGATLLTRFLTGTYFFLIFAAALAWILCGEDKKRRAANLVLAAGVAAALTAPIFWLNREWVWEYYYIGHYVGPESAIRNQHFGLGQSLAFVWHPARAASPRSVLRPPRRDRCRRLRPGDALAHLATLTVFALFGTRQTHRPRRPRRAPTNRPTPRRPPRATCSSSARSSSSRPRSCSRCTNRNPRS